METNFTKGEWIKKNPKNRVIQITNDQDIIICDIDFRASYREYPTPEASEANAKLIAAAPEMYQEHLINKSHCIKVIEMIQKNELEPAIRLLEIMAENSNYCIKKATE